jgi:large subunit ribosomal protein L11
VSYFLKKAAGITAGAKTVGTQIVGKVTKKQVEEIAQQKMPDLNCDTVESAVAQVVGSARSMGLQVVE